MNDREKVLQEVIDWFCKQEYDQDGMVSISWVLERLDLFLNKERDGFGMRFGNNPKLDPIEPVP